MGELYRWQRYFPDAKGGLSDWALWLWCRQCNAERRLLSAGSWDCNWRWSNYPWGLCCVLVHIFRQNTVSRLQINKSVQFNQTLHGSLESCSPHLKLLRHISGGLCQTATCSYCTTSWTASKFQHFFAHLSFTSSRVLFSGHWLLPLHICMPAHVRQYLSRCENDGRSPACSTFFHHGEIYIEHRYRILTKMVCTQLYDLIKEAERGFRLAESGLQLGAGTGTFHASRAYYIEKLAHMTYFLMCGHGKQARITILHCTWWAVSASSWIQTPSSGDAHAGRSALHRGGLASEGRWCDREYVETSWILGENGMMRCQCKLASYRYHWAFYIGCDTTGGVVWQEGYDLLVHTLDTDTKDRPADRDLVGPISQCNLQPMLLKPVSNTWSCHLHG